MRLRIVSLAIVLSTPLLAAALLGLSTRALPASADSATGSITGQVVWNAPVPYMVPGQPGAGVAPGAAPGETVPALPPGFGPDDTPNRGMAPSGQGQAAPGLQVVPSPPDQVAPETDAQGMPVPPPGYPRPTYYPRLIPAGAVLVAVQGTSLSARTDENGRFRIDNVPTGQYWTVAAGPVRGVSSTYALRPNVFLQNANQAVNLGQLSLGQQYRVGPLPYGAPDAAEPEMDSPE